MDKELFLLEDLRQLSNEVNDLIFTFRDRLTPTVLRDELDGIIARRMLSIEIDLIREARFAGRVLYEVQFKNIRHRLHVPKSELTKDEYKHLIRRLREELFDSIVEKRELIFDAPKRWIYLLEEDGNNLVIGYSEVVRFTTDLEGEYRRCRNCVEKALGRKPSKEDWKTVLVSIDEDEPKAPFMENCMVHCELIDIVAEVEDKFQMNLDTELEKAFNEVFGKRK
jgi:hypothetical protein